MRSLPNIDVLYFAILNVFVTHAMSSYVETSMASSEDPAVLIYSQTDVDKQNISPEEIKIDKEIDAIQRRTCLILVGDCWLYLKKTKFWYCEEHRHNVCLKKIQGFTLCRSVSENDMKNAIIEKQSRFVNDTQERDENALEVEYREGRLYYLKAKWKTMRIKAADYGIRLHSNLTVNSTSNSTLNLTLKSTSNFTSKPTLGSTSKPTLKSTSKSASKSNSKSTSRPNSKSSSKSTSKSTLKPNSKSTSKSNSKSTSKSNSKSNSKSTSKSNSKSTSKSNSKSSSKSNSKSISKSTSKSKTTIKPESDSDSSSDES